MSRLNVLARAFIWNACRWMMFYRSWLRKHCLSSTTCSDISSASTSLKEKQVMYTALWKLYSKEQEWKRLARRPFPSFVSSTFPSSPVSSRLLLSGHTARYFSHITSSNKHDLPPFCNFHTMGISLSGSRFLSTSFIWRGSTMVPTESRYHTDAIVPRNKKVTVCEVRGFFLVGYV